MSELLARAIQHHRAGELQAAEGIYRQIVQEDPQNADALHLLGVIAHQMGNQQLAIEFIHRAITLQPQAATFYLNLGAAHKALDQLPEASRSYQEAIRLKPDYADAHSNLAIVLKAEGKLDEAIASYRRAIHFNPKQAAAHHNLAVALRAQGQLEEAAACYQRAVQLKPNYATAHAGLGRVRKMQGKLEAAVSCFERALQYQPDYAEAHGNLADTFRLQGKFDDAVRSFEKALSIKPDHRESLNNLGVTLQQDGRLAEAIATYRRLVKLHPDHAEGHNNLGTALREAGKPQEALAACRRAVQLAPDYAEAHRNLGTLLQEEGKLEEAIQACRRALEVDPVDADAHLNLALTLLSKADYPAGWDEYEWRWKTAEYRTRGFEQPQWDGRRLAGQSILVYAEQGLGDTIQFVRYLPLVKQRLGKVIFECQKPLVKLLQGAAGIDELIVRGDALPPFDLHSPLLSLPRAFRTDIGTIPAEIPYLTADPQLVAVWRARMEPYRGYKVGICWQGSTHFSRDQFRSIPLSCFAPLAEILGVDLISLQKGHGAEQLGALETPFPLVDLNDILDVDHGPFMDTAALMMNLDLIVTCDTAIAHLAGALGVTVWLAEEFAADWRWMREREDSPWYPTIRLFRQTEFGDWGGVFQRIKTALQRERPSR